MFIFSSEQEEEEQQKQEKEEKEEHEEEEEEEEQEKEQVFDVVPSSGLLEAHITHVSRSKVILKVHFTAR